jgi:DNA polymerase (family 10)
MMRRTNGDVAAFLRRIADLHDILEDNAFKTRAYRVGADAVDELHEPVAEIARGGQAALRELPGIGKSISAQIEAYLSTGSSPAFEELSEVIPRTAVDVLALRGVGVRSARGFYRDFGIASVEDLLNFAEGGGFAVVHWLPERAAERIIASAREFEASRRRIPLADAEHLASSMAAQIGALAGIALPRAVGEVRRCRPEVHAIEILAIGDATVAATVASLADAWGADEVVVMLPTRIECSTAAGIPAVVYVATAAEHWPALVATTGSARHVRELREVAASRGLVFRGWRVTEREVGSAEVEVVIRSEPDLYDRFGLRFVPPELREGSGEVEDARRP